MEIKEILERLADHVDQFEENKDLNSARKAAEAICKIILLSSEKTEAGIKASETTLNPLIDNISVKTTGIKPFHIKKLKIELTTIRDYCNEASHDNETIINNGDYERAKTALDNLIIYTFDAKEENLIIDEEIPSSIYIKINKKSNYPKTGDVKK
ncbi:MAG: hypothetical protein ACKVIS_08440 [Pseudomonadales bacterium]